MPLRLTPAHDQAIRAHTCADYPHECCGFLVGTLDGENATVHRAIPAANTRTDSPRNRFEIDPGELVKVDRAARANQLSVIGFYHSHPDAPATPSLYDREHAWAGYCYVIISVQSGQAKAMQNWLLDDDRTQFTQDEITISEDAIMLQETT